MLRARHSVPESLEVTLCNDAAGRGDSGVTTSVTLSGGGEVTQQELKQSSSYGAAWKFVSPSEFSVFLHGFDLELHQMFTKS